MSSICKKRQDCFLRDVYAVDSKDGISEEVVKWCEVCGAIVVDRESDGRVYPGEIVEMNFPQIFKES